MIGLWYLVAVYVLIGPCSACLLEQYNVHSTCGIFGGIY